MPAHSLVEELRQVVGKANVLSSGVNLQLYQYDAYLEERRPDAVVFVNSTADMVLTLPSQYFRRGERTLGAEPGKAKAKIGYFVSCGLSFQVPEVVEATLRVLGRAGCSVTVLNNTCCGRPAQAYGDLEAARDIARRNVERPASAMSFDAIVSECGSCSAHLKDYGDILKGDAAYAERAAALSKKVKSFSEFLHHTEASGVLDRKMGNVQKTGATILAIECPACMMHLSYGARKKGLAIHVRHVSQILDQTQTAAGT